MSKLSPETRSACRSFAFYLANGTVDVELLEDIDYRPGLVELGSELEQVFAIFFNVLEVDEEGVPINQHLAQRRAAQWIRQYHDSAYHVEPPFEDWELELH